MRERPELVLATVSGASFLAGALLGSRLGRAVLAALVPIAIQHAVEAELGPRLRAYMSGLFEDANPNGAGKPS
jgi:hypothetical protein